MKRLALLALLLASSCVVAAPAPLPKAQRKAERPAAVQTQTSAAVLNTGKLDVANAAVCWAKLPPSVQRQLQQQVQPAQPPNADPPG